MTIPQIYVPPDLPNEVRQKVAAVNELLRAVTVEVARLNANPELYSIEQRQDVVGRCGITLDRFKQMREDLRQYGLEWSEWPDMIE